MLLDDLFSELDVAACREIVKLLGQDHQVIVTAVDHSYQNLSLLSVPALPIEQGEIVTTAHAEPVLC